MRFSSLRFLQKFAAAISAMLLWSFSAGMAQQPAAKAPAAPPAATGLWIDHTGRGAVEISPCADGLCGRIVWLQQPNDKAGRPLLDGKNEDRAKRSQPVCGLQIIGGLKHQADGSWDNGWIYDPEQGEKFDLELKLMSPDLLQVTGYKGLKFLSETYKWKRAQAPPTPKCAS